MIKFSLTVSNRLRAPSALFQILGTVAVVIASIFVVYQAPSEIRELSLSIRFSVVAPILFGGIGLLVFFSLGHAVSTFLGLAWTLVLFGLSLKALWLSGISEPSVVGGLLPWSDSLQYLSSAREVVLQGNIDPAGSNRPIFPIVFRFRSKNSVSYFRKLQWSMRFFPRQFSPKKVRSFIWSCHRNNSFSFL